MHFPISKEFTLIFNFIDYENYYPIEQLIILKKRYKISQKILEINIDDIDFQFDNCYYRNIKILFFKDILNFVENIITVYYNQKNYFNSLVFYNALEPLNNSPYEIKEDILYPDILFLIGQNLNVLSLFNKDMTYESSFIQDNTKKNF